MARSSTWWQGITEDQDGGIEAATGRRYVEGMPHAIPPETDEVHLWQRILAGDVAAFGVWHARYDSRLHAFLLSRCRPPLDVEDISQRVWLRVWEKRTQWNSQGGTFLSWLFQIASNDRNSVLRGMQRRPEEALAEGIDRTAPHNPDEDEHLLALRKCLAELGGTYVEVLRLRLTGELNDSEIAERLGITVGTVYQRASRGRNEVRQCMERKLA